jgi:periplasmic protein TonB
MSTERRQQARKVPKDFTYIRVGEDSGGRVLNVSEEGLCFEALSPIRYKESFQFWLSFNLIDRIDGAGKIVWMDTTKRIAGVRFMDLSEYSREQIRSWLNETASVEATPREGIEVVDLPLTGSDAVEVPLTSPALAQGAVDSSVPAYSHLSDGPALSAGTATFDEAVSSESASTSFPGQVQRELHALTGLVPLARHLTAARLQFVRGVLLGIVICGVIMLPLFKYVTRQKDASSVEGSAPPATVSAGTLTESPAASSASGLTKSLLVTPAASKTAPRQRPSQSRSNPAEASAGRQNLNPQEAKLAAQPPGAPSNNTESSTANAPDNRDAVSAPQNTRPLEQPSAALANPATPAVSNAANSQRTGESSARLAASAVTPAANPSAEVPASHSASPVSPFPVGGDVRPPRLLKSFAPVYPSLARTQRISGDVKVDALIDATGQVEAVKVLTGPLLLQRSAVEAVKQWKYTPGVLDGKPTAMHITVVLQFRIPAQTP